MTDYKIIGHCPECGCPIYQSVYWAGSGYPPAEYICQCHKGKKATANGFDDNGNPVHYAYG